MTDEEFSTAMEKFRAFEDRLKDLEPPRGRDMEDTEAEGFLSGLRDENSPLPQGEG